MNIMVNDGNIEDNIYFRDNKGDSALGYMIENKNLSKNLIKIITREKNIKKFDLKLINFIKDENEAVLTLDKKINIKCNLLIGADGKESLVRSLAGISFYKKDYYQKAFIFNIKHEKKHNYLATENFLEQGPLASLPIKKNNSEFFSSIVWSCNNPFFYKIMHYKKSNIENLISNYLKPHYGKIKIISDINNWDLFLIKSNKYIDHRLVLLGDSAHSIHPLAGQGFNLTVRGIESLYFLADQNLNQKQNLGNLKNLSFFNSRQYLDSKAIIFATDKLNFLFSNSNFFLKKVRRSGLYLFNNNKYLKNIFRNYASEGKASLR